MPHVLASVLTAISLGVALYLVQRQRVLAQELRALREQLRDLSGRLAGTEKSAAEAASHAEVAANVLLEKGLANEEDLEAARRRFDAPEEQQPARGSRTLH
jgi:hypothetical protein